MQAIQSRDTLYSTQAWGEIEESIHSLFIPVLFMISDLLIGLVARYFHEYAVYYGMMIMWGTICSLVWGTALGIWAGYSMHRQYQRAITVFKILPREIIIQDKRLSLWYRSVFKNNNIQ